MTALVPVLAVAACSSPPQDVPDATVVAADAPMDAAAAPLDPAAFGVDASTSASAEISPPWRLTPAVGVAGAGDASAGFGAGPTAAERARISRILDDSVDDAAADGTTLSWCLRPLDAAGAASAATATAKKEETTAAMCAGDATTDVFAASIPKLAVAVAAIEAYRGALDTPLVDGYTPYSAGNAGLRVAYDEAVSGEDTDEGTTETATTSATGAADAGHADDADDADDATSAPRRADVHRAGPSPEEAAAEARREDTPTTLGDVVAAAIAYSDNTAANMLLDAIPDGPGFDATRDRSAFSFIRAISDRLDLGESFYVGTEFDTDAESDWNHITADSTAAYVAGLVAAADGDVPDDALDTVRGGALTTPRAARAVLLAMAQQVRTTKIPGRLPDGTSANKTGETDTRSHDVAVLGTGSGRFVLAAVSQFPEGSAPPDDEIAAVAREVVDVLGGPEPF